MTQPIIISSHLKSNSFIFAQWPKFIKSIKFKIPGLYNCWIHTPMFPQHSDHPPLHLRPRLRGCLLHPHPVRRHWARHGAGLPVLVWCRDLCLCHLPPTPPDCVWDSQLLQGLHDLQDAPHQPDPGCQDQHRRHCHHQYHSLPVPRSGNILVLIMKLSFIIF